jgi:hypothetical protein
VFRLALIGFAVLLAAGVAVFVVRDDPASAGGPQFASRPDLDPPVPKVTGAASADVFLAPKATNGQSGPMILDPTGGLIWFHPEPAGIIPNDFKVQTYQGKPVLTWWEGKTNTRGYGQGSWVIADSSYHQIARVSAGDGLYGDLHDMQLTDRGTALITIYHAVRADLSPLHSLKDGHAVDSIVQEIDVATGKVLFSWHSIGHVPFKQSYAGPPAPGHDFPYDYFHVNSVAVDTDGNLLISARNTWTVYKVDRTTGKIIWRLGGMKSSFKLGDGARFAWQHDVRPQPDGTITMFDNESTPKEADASRLLTLKVDEAAKTATVVKALTHPDGDLLVDAEGDYQPLPNGDAFAGWGITGRASELTATGAVKFDLTLPSGYDTYRAFATAWHGTPADPPAQSVARRAGMLTVRASWNGATDVTRWELLAGPRPDALQPVDNRPRAGFETTLSARTDEPYVAVRALDGDRVLATSAPAR